MAAAEDTRRAQQRRHALLEIVETEKAYVRDLTVITENVLVPLKGLGLIDAEAMRQIFSNIEDLHFLHVQLLNVIAERERHLADGELVSISECFLDLGNQFNVYNEFCASHAAMGPALEAACAGNETFAQFVSAVEADEAFRSLRLQDFLLCPVQRVCKYPLLFRELLKYTDAESDAYGTADRVLTKMSLLAELVNETKRGVESRARVSEVAEEISGWPKKLDITADPNRMVLLEGSVKKEYNRRQQPRYFVVFNDLIVYAKEKKSGEREYKGSMRLEDVMLIRDDDGGDGGGGGGGGGRGGRRSDASAHRIKLLRKDKDKLYRLHFETRTEKERWFQTIQTQIAAVAGERLAAQEREAQSRGNKSSGSAKGKKKRKGLFSRLRKGSRDSGSTLSSADTSATSALSGESDSDDLDSDDEGVSGLAPSRTTGNHPMRLRKSNSVGSLGMASAVPRRISYGNGVGSGSGGSGISDEGNRRGSYHSSDHGGDQSNAGATDGAVLDVPIITTTGALVAGTVDEGGGAERRFRSYDDYDDLDASPDEPQMYFFGGGGDYELA